MLNFHQVVTAKKKDTGNVYALKIMDKNFIRKENKAYNAKLERVVLDQLDHPGIIRLCFTFQDNLCVCKCLSFVFLFHLSVVSVINISKLCLGPCLDRSSSFICALSSWRSTVIVNIQCFLDSFDFSPFRK